MFESVISFRERYENARYRSIGRSDFHEAGIAGAVALEKRIWNASGKAVNEQSGRRVGQRSTHLIQEPGAGDDVQPEAQPRAINCVTGELIEGRTLRPALGVWNGAGSAETRLCAVNTFFYNNFHPFQSFRSKPI